MLVDAVVEGGRDRTRLAEVLGLPAVKEAGVGQAEPVGDVGGGVPVEEHRHGVATELLGNRRREGEEFAVAGEGFVAMTDSRFAGHGKHSACPSKC